MFSAVLTAASFSTLTAAEPDSKYPDTRRSDHVDAYHGVEVPDPYRWLEDPDSAESKSWVEAQNKVTFSYLEGIPQRAALKERLTKLWNFERYGTPEQRGGRYFYTRNDGLQNQSVLYVADSLDAPPRELLDPNKLSQDGTVALVGSEVSEDGRYLAYGLAAAGSDWNEWKVKEVATGRDLSDHLRWVKFSGVSWTPDNLGFFYSRYDEPKAGEELTGVNYYQKLYYHRLGDSQDKDVLTYQRKDQKEWGFRGGVTEDGRYLIISVWRGTETKNQVFYKRLDSPDAAVVELLAGFDAEYEFLGNDGSVFWFLTDLDAPLRRVIAIDAERPEREHWRELIPQAEHVVSGASVVGDRFLIAYLKDAATQVRVFDLTGRPEREIALPAIGQASGFGGRRKDRETFYQFTNFTTPPTVYRYGLGDGASTVFRQPKVDFDPQEYETKQVFYHSKDGTRVPMFITHRKGLKLDGNNPTLMYAYGGFNISITPSFSVMNLVWMEQGGVFAVPNLRGGGEYGRAWHEAGMKDKKQNVFDDFIAAGRVADREQVHLPAETGHPRRQQRRTAGRGGHDTATRTVRRGLAGGRRDGHAAVPQVHDRLGLGVRIRFVGQPRRIPDAAQVLAAAQSQAGHASIPRRWSRRPTTMTASCRGTVSSLRRHCSTRMRAMRPC